MLAALFSNSTVPPPPPRDRVKSHRVRDEEESRAWKKECHELEAVRRASLIDGGTRQLRAIKLAAEVSSNRVFEAERSTTDDVVVAEDTIEVVPTKEGTGSGKPDL